MSLNPPIPIHVGDAVLFADPFTLRILAGRVKAITRKHVSIKGSDGNTYGLHREDIVGCTPRCTSRWTDERCQRARGHKGRHFSHASSPDAGYGVVEWKDKKKAAPNGGHE